MERDTRQDMAIEAWANRGAVGTIVWPTGSGKSRIGQKGALRMQRRFPEHKVLVISPFSVLEEQWKQQGIPNLTSMTVQSLIRGDGVDTDLLIVDEAHKMAAESFSQVFQLVKYRYVMCLTATLDRIDGREHIIKRYAPICDELQYKQAVDWGYIMAVEEYNVGVPFYGDEYDLYHGINETARAMSKWFNHDYQLMLSCATDKSYTKLNEAGISVRVRYAYEVASRLNVEVGKVIGIAKKGIKATAERKTILHKSESKIEACHRVLRKGLDKGYTIVVFGESQDICDRIHSLFPEDSLLYYSKGGKKKNEANLNLFKEGAKRILITAKALNAAVDIPDVDMGVIISRTSSAIEYRQRRGRICRTRPEKKTPLLINLVLPNTQDENWNKGAQAGTRGIINVDDVGDMLQIIEDKND
jgi:superfamily II DNA or RNA helicase